jgi:hypothetical protein
MSQVTKQLQTPSADEVVTALSSLARSNSQDSTAQSVVDRWRESVVDMPEIRKAIANCHTPEH